MALGLLFRLTLRLRHTLEFLLLRGASVIAHILPRRLLLPLGRLLGRAVFSFLPWRLRPPRECRAPPDHARRRFRATSIRAPRPAPRSRVAPILAAAAAPRARPRRAGGRRRARRPHPVHFRSAHVGLWELLPRAVAPHLPAAARQHGLLVYRPLHNAAVDRWLRRRRARAAGMPLVADHGRRRRCGARSSAAASSACCPTSGRRAPPSPSTFSAGRRPLAPASPRCAARPAGPSGLSRSCSTTTPPARRCSPPASSSSRRAATARRLRLGRRRLAHAELRRRARRDDRRVPGAVLLVAPAPEGSLSSRRHRCGRITLKNASELRPSDKS